MANEWRINRVDVKGGISGELLDGCEVRQKADGSGYEFLAVVAETNQTEMPVKFPPFAYQGLIWNIEIGKFELGHRGEQPHGSWNNNARPISPAQDESGTWTAQAGSGGAEEDGKEDAASASA